MRIPEIRDRLHEIAKDIHTRYHASRALQDIATELHELAEETRRRPQNLSGRRPSKPMTPELEDQIRSMKVQSPDITHHEVAAILKINSARVSEVLHGKRR